MKTVSITVNVEGEASEEEKREYENRLVTAIQSQVGCHDFSFHYVNFRSERVLTSEQMKEIAAEVKHSYGDAVKHANETADRLNALSAKDIAKSNNRYNIIRTGNVFLSGCAVILAIYSILYALLHSP
jgi:hypothetical protein